MAEPRLVSRRLHGDGQELFVVAFEVALQQSDHVTSRAHKILQFDSQMVARRIGEVLPHVEVPLGGQYRLVPERELNLFERRMAAMRQFSKCAAQIMRSDSDPQLLGIAAEQ